jgi:hypothetical protein
MAGEMETVGNAPGRSSADLAAKRRKKAARADSVRSFRPPRISSSGRYDSLNSIAFLWLKIFNPFQGAITGKETSTIVRNVRSSEARYPLDPLLPTSTPSKILSDQIKSATRSFAKTSRCGPSSLAGAILKRYPSGQIYSTVRPENDESKSRLLHREV